MSLSCPVELGDESVQVRVSVSAIQLFVAALELPQPRLGEQSVLRHLPPTRKRKF